MKVFSAAKTKTMYQYDTLLPFTGGWQDGARESFIIPLQEEGSEV